MSILRGLISEKRKRYAVEAAKVESMIGAVTAELDLVGAPYKVSPNLILIYYGPDNSCGMNINVKNGWYTYGFGCIPTNSAPLVSLGQLLECIAERLA